MTNNDSSKPASPLGSVFGYLKKGFIQIGIFSFFINLMMLAPPLYMLQVYDRVLTSRSQETLLLLTLILGWMFLTMGILEFSRSRMMVRLSNQFDSHLGKRIHRAIVKLSYTAASSPGSRPVDDMGSIRQFMTGTGAFAFFDAPWVPIYLAILFLFNPMFGLMGVSAVIILASLAMINELSTRKLQQNNSYQQSVATQQLSNQIQHTDVIKAMGMQTAMLERWHKLHNEHIYSHSKMIDRSTIWITLSKSLRLLFQSLMLGLGAYLAINNQITAGMVIAGSIILGRALSPIDQMINSWKGFVNARTAYQRLNQFLSGVPEEEKRVSLPVPKGAVSVEKLVLIPPGSKIPSLKGISFFVRPGEALAVIGGSAAGKSSLVKAMLGLWPVAAGSVCIDGAKIDHWNPQELGPHIGYLPQDVELFDGTIAENIARFLDADEKYVIRAAQIAGVDQLIRNLPDGYNTRIGSNAMTLSGGQRQRIGLARAIYRRPKIIILDEPNSNLDREGEKALSAAFCYLKKKGVTLILISHRQRILRHVDKILLLENGMQQLLGPRDAVLDHMKTINKAVSPVPDRRGNKHQLKPAG